MEIKLKNGNYYLCERIETIVRQELVYTEPNRHDDRTSPFWLTIGHNPKVLDLDQWQPVRCTTDQAAKLQNRTEIASQPLNLSPTLLEQSKSLHSRIETLQNASIALAKVTQLNITIDRGIFIGLEEELKTATKQQRQIDEKIRHTIQK